MRDLTKEPDELVVAERKRVATEGWGAQILALQGPDGKWGGDNFQRSGHLHFTPCCF